MNENLLNTPWTFDGYCPETLCDDQQFVRMQLNSDDFWESPATRLQIAVHPPFAVILHWRGKGEFREEQPEDVPQGLLYCAAGFKAGEDHFPDEQRILQMPLDISGYIEGLYPDQETYEASERDTRGHVVHEQEKRLLNMDERPRTEVLHALRDFLQHFPSDEDTLYEHIWPLHDVLYRHNIPPVFHWMAWHEGRRAMQDPSTNFSTFTLVELCRLFTVLFRSDRFIMGSMYSSYELGLVHQLVQALEKKLAQAV